MNKDIAVIREEVNKHLENKETLKTLVATTFKGLNEAVVPQAIVEGMIRGFDFKDFLEKNIYAIPFSSGYSLVTSIDYARKKGMRAGIVGKNAPVFEMDADGKKIVSCAVTVKRKIDDYIGEYTAQVYFDEYYKPGKNGYPSLWDSKPRTMISKVAEMHALRMACPEELSQAYVEEEMEKEQKVKPVVDIEAYRKKLEATKTMQELKDVWATMPPEAKAALETLKDEIKKEYENLNL